MTIMHKISRRQFIATSLTAAGGFALGIGTGSFAEAATLSPRPWSDVSSQQTIGLRPVAAQGSIASSSRQPVRSQSLNRASTGRRYGRPSALSCRGSGTNLRYTVSSGSTRLFSR